MTQAVPEKSFMEERGLTVPQSTHLGPSRAARLVDSYGCHVHPLKLGMKAPATSSGLKDAKPDASDITGNYGVHTGRSGLVIVDLDDYVSGNGVADFIREFELTPTFSVITGSGGRSWWYQAPEGSKYRSAQNFAGYTGVDIKAGESYALGPGCQLHPSQIKEGATGNGSYEWDSGVGVKEFSELPPKLAAKLEEAARPKVVAVSDTPHEAYDAMDDATKARVDKYVATALSGIYAWMDRAKTWAKNEYPEGDGWNPGTLSRTKEVAELVKADWNSYDVDQAQNDLLEHLPRDSGFPLGTGMSMFLRAMSKEDVAPRRYPLDDDVDLMAGLPYRPGKALGGDPDAPVGSPPQAKREYKLENGPGDADWLLSELGTNGLSGFFLRGGQLVYTSTVDSEGYIPPRDKRDQNGPATIQTANWEKVAGKVDKHYQVYTMKEGEDGKKWPARDYMPMRAVKSALANIDVAAGLRQLHGVTHTPIVRADGSILSTPGYDDATGLLYLPDVEVEVPSDDAILAAVPAAIGRIRSMISEFSWTGPDDEANYLGLMLTPLLRELCPPPYKMGAIGAHQPGSGKSLLGRVLRDIHGGVLRADMPMTEDELSKSVVGILSQTTAPVVQFDNVTRTLRSPMLTALLTTATYSGRLLGSSSSVSMTNDRLWIITGNNLSLGGDLTRRTLWCTIDPGVPNPEERTGFRLDLPLYVAANRGQILADLLVLIRGWILAGSPAEPPSSSDDYAQWTTTVRGILAHAGVPGLFDGTKVESTNEDDAEWALFLATAYDLTEGREWTAGDLLSKGDESAAVYQKLLASLPEKLHDKAVRSNLRATGKSLGRLATAQEGRHVSGLVLKQVGMRKGVKVWRVRKY